MALNLCDIPAELLHCIFHFCSQRDLTSLAQVNSTFQQAAEDTLYRHIYISFNPFDLIPDKTSQSWEITEKSLFYTLSSNPQKAALLRYFHVQFEFTLPCDGTRAHNSIMRRIVDALQNAPNLVDLRIMVDVSYTFGNLSEAIKSGCFQLCTLYCNASCQDLEGIIISQKHLQLLGIYSFLSNAVSKLVTTLCNNRLGIDSNRQLPGIFLLGSHGPTYGRSKLILFPELCLPGQAFALCKNIATSLEQDLGKRYTAHPWIMIKVFDISYCRGPIISEMVDATSKYFPGCETFSIEIRSVEELGLDSQPWMTPGLLTSLSRFKRLQKLEFGVADDSLPRQVAIDLGPLLKKLVFDCPSLRIAYVHGALGGADIRSTSNWEVVNDDMMYSRPVTPEWR